MRSTGAANSSRPEANSPIAAPSTPALPDRLILASTVMIKRILTLAAVASLVALAVKLAVTPTIGTSFDRSKVPIWGLPEIASDVDFVMRPNMPVSAYSFTTDEPSFVAWSENYLGLIDVRTGNVSIQTIDPVSGNVTVVESENGVEYRWSEEDRGQYTMFDRNGQRAYYFAHTR